MFMLKIGCATVLMGIVLWLGMGSEQSWLVSNGWSRVIRLSVLVVVGIAVYFATLAVLGFRAQDFAKRSVN
jgi:putative peptidoglycan lipid II flippase